jgi:D-alanyl-D-alanine carboxypeptidase
MQGKREGSRPLTRIATLTAGLGSLVAVMASGPLAPAQAGSTPYAAMAIDANTGAVLHNRAGDAERYPASLTKMMTLYMTFELIELGRLDYATKIKMTEEAAAASPSKLGLKAGEEIRVIDAIKVLVTKSANDVAVALAQHIGGTEGNFARLMTRKARQIGMKSTTFKNASGLPDDAQVTTARDMLTLALRLQDAFPQHYELFATRTFTYAGKTYRNHNALLGRYEGTDGIKTGYTRASGFNLVTSVRRGGKRVVAAVFGGKTGRIRNARMRALLDKALAKASTKVTRKPAVFVRAPQPVAIKAPPRTKPPAETAAVPTQANPPPVASADAAGSIAVAKVRRILIGPELSRRPAPAAAETREAHEPVFATAGAAHTSLPQFAQGLPPSTLEAQAAALERSTPVPAEPAPQDSPARREAARTPTGPFAIQIGAYSDSADAEQHMDVARRRANGLLDPYHAVAVPFRKGSSQLFRARFRGFDAAAAASACLQLRRLEIDCFVVATQ